MPIKTIITANIAEAFEPSIEKIASATDREARVQIEHNLCDRTLLWEGDDKIVITPYPIDQGLFEHNRRTLGYENISNLSPHAVNVSLSDAILEDRQLFQQLVDIIRANPGITLSPYCVTEKFLALVETLKKEGLDFIVPERPAKYGDWLVTYLDSKVGSRVEIGKIDNPQIAIPESIPCRTKDEALRVATWFFSRRRSCVLKANFGESGWGLLMLRREQFKNTRQLIKYINHEFESTPIWNDDLILVEELIESQRDSEAYSPSSELLVSDRNTVITYLCNQEIGSNGTFLGVAIGRGIMKEDLATQIREISTRIGNRFRLLGYRGFFDIDFVTSGNGIPYPIETNMRRTGGTHVFDATKFLIGDNWENNCYALSSDDFEYGNINLSTPDILARLHDILYPIQGQREGVVVSIVNRRQPKIGFIIIGEDREKALEIYKKLLNTFGLQNR